MQYMTIKNVGVCPIEGFTMLGVSSARGNEDAIGQFGSGAKHGVLTCLRMGLNPIIYLGRDKIQFHTEPARLPNGTQYNKVFIKVNQKAPKELSMALEYGSLDWDDINMALREFVSNALDSVGGDSSKVVIKNVERIHPEEGCTVIGVPMTPDVQRFWQDIPSRFLQFKPNFVQDKKFIAKTETGPAKVYRKGVLVRALFGEKSLFDYNFGEELKIDEARNLDAYYVGSAAAKALAKDEAALEVVFRSLIRGEKTWEESIGGNYYVKAYAEIHSDMWKRVWKKVVGENGILAPMGVMDMLGETAKQKGYTAYVIDSVGWLGAMLTAKIPCLFDVMDNVNDKGHEIMEPTAEVKKCRDEVWDWLEVLKLTNGKAKPPVMMFRPIMQGGSETLGYYKGGTVYMGVEYATNKKVMVEELAHYITGAADATRDFQDFAFRIAGGMMSV